MRNKEFPGCCTARVVYDFGGTMTSAFNTGGVTKARIKAYLRLRIKSAKGIECLIATTNDDQTEANQALEEMGFNCSDWMHKKRHSETKLKLWWKEP